MLVGTRPIRPRCMKAGSMVTVIGVWPRKSGGWARPKLKKGQLTDTIKHVSMNLKLEDRTLVDVGSARSVRADYYTCGHRWGFSWSGGENDMVATPNLMAVYFAVILCLPQDSA